METQTTTQNESILGLDTRLLKGTWSLHIDTGTTMTDVDERGKKLRAPVALCGLVFWKPQRRSSGNVTCERCVEIRNINIQSRRVN